MIENRYQEIIQQRLYSPESETVYGPVVDNLVVPNQPYQIMSQYHDSFSRFVIATASFIYHILSYVHMCHLQI